MLDSEFEKRLADLEKRVSILEQNKNNQRQANFLQDIITKIDEIGTQDLVILALKEKPNSTKSEIKNILSDWGKSYGNWFEGGNFGGRLIKKGLVKKADKNEKGEDRFLLTKKGEKRADDLK
ncbi:MAG: hypothetical protein DA330_07020 [Nitrososphaera sp.]|nr:hypothetical protein [Nitrososphaera sp.]